MHPTQPTPDSEAGGPDTEPEPPVTARSGQSIHALDTESRFLVADLCDLLGTYLGPDEVRQVYDSYLFSAQAHIDQTRLTGEPYIYHPIAVARILAEMRMDPQTLMAAILHDVIEDTPTAKDEIASEFGEEVATLVDGVSKIDAVNFSSRQEAQIASLQKVLLAMTDDVRVILIKLADRLHNMRTLGIMKPEKRRRIAKETLAIYSPIAYRLGMNDIRLELEDLGFRHHYPMRYHILETAVAKVRGHRKQVIEKTQNAFRRRLKQEGIEAGVSGREKHLYSIYRKMRTKHTTFREMTDIYGFRILTNSAGDCYRVLGVVHSLYKPVPGKFKDYIAIPKSNGYQSLHTVLLGPYGLRIEVQIRTQEMQLLADDGIAAHWHYKSSNTNGSANARAYEWLQSVLQMQREAGNSEEFLENVKIDLFPDETYTFTPAGDIIELPRGATVLDFAYAVHTDVGHQCISAMVDGRPVTRSTPLRTAQTIRVITSTNARPSADSLNFVRTGKARSAIRHYLKNLQADEAAEIGQRILALLLSQLGQKWSELTKAQIQLTLDRLGYKEINDLLVDVGLGKRMAPMVAQHFLAETHVDDVSEDEQSAKLTISGAEGMLLNFPRCCRPIPGDPIVGAFRAGKGLVVHRMGCRNLAHESKQPEELLDLQWASELHQEFVTELNVDVGNQLGVLARIASVISDAGSNIENVSTEERDGVTSSLHLALTVRDRDHLAKVIRTVRAVSEVVKVKRVSGV